MAHERANRKMSAILSADVKGYSRLMSVDEEGTVKALNECREIIARCVEDHRGRVVDSPGDNVLAEFVSTVEAVKCAVKIQKDLKVRNAELAKDKRMKFRIGVNLGDVIEEKDRIYGDGVNIAARLEGLAEAGGICISGTAFDQVKGKLSLGYRFVGEQTVKNIPDPIRAYRVLMDERDAGKLIGVRKRAPKSRWAEIAAIVVFIAIGLVIYQFYARSPAIEPASVDKMAFPLPKRPSIAVLPFDNMSGDPKEDYFSDGLTEQIITSLSKYPRLFVIARQSSFYYKDKPVKVQQVAEELGVQYVLEGSVQKSGDQLRITAQLIDALAGHHIWSERYDRELKDIFDLQDEITINIMNNLVAELAEGEQVRRWTEKRVTNLKALEKHYQAQGFFCRHTKEDYEKARPLFEEAIALEPEFIYPYVYLGYLHNLTGARGYSEDRTKSFQTAFELAQKALAIDDSHDGAHALMAACYNARREYDKALSEAERAIALNPNSSDGYLVMGSALGYSGRWEESAIYAKKYLRINPFPGAYIYSILGRAYFMTGQYEESIATWKKALKVSPNYLTAHRFLAACYSSLGRDAEARAATNEVLRINPKFTTGSLAKRLIYKNKADIEREVAALKKAGLPEHPPLQLPDKPSIAVLAFDNLSGDPEQEYFSDGLTDELISDLAKIHDILVISRNSTFTYKGKSVKAQEIAKDLNVRYILEGSVQRSGGKVRIRAQLIDGQTDHHLWSESYDGVMGDIFVLQDKITEKIVSALAIKLTSDEQLQRTQKQTNSIPAYHAFLRGMAYLRLYTPDDLIKAIQYFMEAVSLDPNYSEAYTALAKAYAIIGPGGRVYWRKAGIEWEDAWIYTRHFTELAMKKPVPQTYSILGRLETLIRDWDKVTVYAEKAVALAPNDSEVLYEAGRALSWAGKPQDAIKYLKRSNKLDPLNKAGVYMAFPYFSLKQYKEAVTAFEQGATNVRDEAGILPFAAASYAFLGRKEEAKATLDKWIQLVGRISADAIYSTYGMKNIEVFDRFMEGITLAGREGSTKIYIRVDENRKLTGQQIKELMFGRTEFIGAYFIDQFFHRKEDGEVTYQAGDSIDSGISWIENDKLCNKFEKRFGGYNDCFYIYENPIGDSKYKNDYVKVTDYGLVQFTLEK